MMKQSWNYSLNFRPPSPVVEVDLSLPWRDFSAVVTQSLQIDSGADITGIPMEVLTSLGAKPVGIQTAIDFNRRPVKIPLFMLTITLAGETIEVVKVVGVRSQFGFIGRDLLNRFEVTLNGPELETSFSDADPL